MNGPAGPIKRVIDEVECSLSIKSRFVAQGDLDSVSERAFLLLSLPQKSHVVSFAHVKVQIDWVERDECCQQGRGTVARSTSGHEIPDRDEMRAHASGKRRRDTTVIQIELCVADKSFRFAHGCLGRSFFSSSLINVLDGPGIGLLECFRAQ